MSFWIFMMLPFVALGSVAFIDYSLKERDKYNGTLRFYHSRNGESSSGEIKLSFNKFKTFYFADPDNWDLGILGSGGYLPRYTDKAGSKINVYFLSYNEYKKFVKWYEKSKRTGNDYANTEATIQLANMISENVQKRVQESTERTVSAYNEMADILARINEERGKEENGEGISLTL